MYRQIAIQTEAARILRVENLQPSRIIHATDELARAQLQPPLLEGLVDIVAAQLTDTPERQAPAAVTPDS